jgi:cation diffusion facilitator CzcD-associated flavoprotein CzcO
VQLVPEIAKVVGSLSVFQRSANWVLTKDDDPYTPEQLAAFRADPSIVRNLRAELWTMIDVVQTMKTRNVEALERNLRKNLAQVDDPELRARLTPTHPYGCKRPLFSNDWFPTFNRPNVELVTEAIVEITADAIVTADSRRCQVDTLIAATGFETARFASAVAVTGRSGVAIEDAWADGAQAYLGITTSRFPNLFMMYGPNTNNGVILHMLECQADYIVRQVRRMDHEHLAWIDVRPDVMDRYNQRIQADLDTIDVWKPGVCNNYIRAANGRIVTQWPHGMGTYREWTSMPDPDAYEVGTRP